MSNHGGSPSIDNGFGCMHLVDNRRADTLAEAAKDLGVSVTLLKQDIATNVRGGAAVLRDRAIQFSPAHTIPTSLADWYGAVAAYSDAAAPSTVTMYADAAYAVLNAGFRVQADDGEIITLAPQAVHPNVATAGPVLSSIASNTSVPSGCTNDGNVDYPGAIDCVLNPNVYDCSLVAPNAPCTYDGSNRPKTYSISYVVIHDIEGTAQSALSTFQDVNSQVSCHYIVDTNGTVYQVVREKDIAWHAGNYWYNQHAVGIEHAGFDAQGYAWYNATEYLASAKLVAYLLTKYSIPLDRDHVVAHGTVPSPSLQFMPNHVDPGPYWLWDYYLNLIHQQGVPYPATVLQQPPAQGAGSGGPPSASQLLRIFTLQPGSSSAPFGGNGTETKANFNFFYLYKGPSTASGLIPSASSGTDITDETYNVEVGMSYFYVARAADAAGTGDTMYEIWYGEADRLSGGAPSYFMDAKLAWLAVPPGAAEEGPGVRLNAPPGPAGLPITMAGASGTTLAIYGRPTSDAGDIVGEAPAGAAFVSTQTTIEDGTTNLWYEINYNHRQAWVPASEVATS